MFNAFKHQREMESLFWVSCHVTTWLVFYFKKKKDEENITSANNAVNPRQKTFQGLIYRNFSSLSQVWGWHCSQAQTVGKDAENHRQMKRDQPSLSTVSGGPTQAHTGVQTAGNSTSQWHAILEEDDRWKQGWRGDSHTTPKVSPNSLNLG